ncbi:Apolipoprotein L6 [Labeo rohita]|uniref:Apolipoprotein L6 n=1 Tax=Labeo rohita TaxID=84645 RepID=A0ABQ8MJJ4_LABRO|nr:Apolipoprotein L6 [Labeo rohita]
MLWCFFCTNLSYKVPILLHLVISALTVSCRSNARKLKRKKKSKRQCKRKEQPPKILSVFNLLEKQLVALYLRDFSQIQQHMQRVHLIIRTFEEDFSRATGAITNALNAEVAGGLMMGLGLVLAPVHQGISALIAGVGAVVLSGAAISDNIWSKKIISLKAKLMQDTEAELRKFQYKISPMMDKMNEISQLVYERPQFPRA